LEFAASPSEASGSTPTAAASPTTSGSRVTTQTPSRRAARRAAKTSLSIARATSQRSLGPSTGTRRCLALTRSLAGTAQMIIVTGAARPGTLRRWPERGATRHRSATRVSFHTGAEPPGTLTAAPPTIGLAATTRARAPVSASAMPGTARTGPTDVTGFDGQTTTTSASQIASRTPGAGRAWEAPAYSTSRTWTWAFSRTKYSWNESQPSGVRTRV